MLEGLDQLRTTSRQSAILRGVNLNKDSGYTVLKALILVADRLLRRLHFSISLCPRVRELYGRCHRRRQNDTLSELIG